MYVIQKEIDCIKEALEVVKKTENFKRQMDITFKKILEAKYLTDTTFMWSKRPEETQYSILHTPEDMENIIELVSVYQQTKNKTDDITDTLSAMVKRIYTELIKYLVTK